MASGLSRRELLEKAGATAFTVSMFGGLADRATPFAGPLRFTHRQLAGELKIAQWAHALPAYDQWLDNTYLKEWGEKNDVEVKIDHVDIRQLSTLASSEITAQSGHDLFQFLSPPSSLQRHVLPVNDIVEEVTRRLGKVSVIGHRSTYNPATKRYFGFPDNYVPGPVHYRRSVWFNAGIAPTTWERVRRAAPLLRRTGQPVGLGMSSDIDSNLFLFALLHCYGGFLQNQENRVVIGKGRSRTSAIKALKLMRDIFRNGMTEEVFAWEPSADNVAYLRGRLSLAVNSISLARAAEDTGESLAADTWLAPFPGGPNTRLGNAQPMGVYVIWRFAKNKAAAKKYLVDQQFAYWEHFLQSQFFNFPAWTNAIRGGFKTIQSLTAQDMHRPLGKYSVLARIAEKYTTNLGFPGYSNAAIDEIVNRSLVPTMFAQVARDKMKPEDAVRALDREARQIFAKWRGRKLL